MIKTDLELMGYKLPKNILGVPYGVAYRMPALRASVLYPIPFHFIAGWYHKISDRIRYCNQGKYEKALDEARHTGVLEGKEIAKLQSGQELEVARKDGYNQAFINMDTVFEEEFGHPING